MLLVHTQEIEADFTGFPLTVSVWPDCTCGQNGGCSECHTKTVVIEAGERDDGAVGQRLVFRGLTEDVTRVLREVLDLIAA